MFLSLTGSEFGVAPIFSSLTVVPLDASGRGIRVNTEDFADKKSLSTFNVVWSLSHIHRDEVMY